MTHDIVSLTPQIDELMIASDIVRVDLLQGERSVYSHSRARGYRPAGTSDMYRELVVPLIKHRECRYVWLIRTRWVTIFTH